MDVDADVIKELVCVSMLKEMLGEVEPQFVTLLEHFVGEDGNMDLDDEDMEDLQVVLRKILLRMSQIKDLGEQEEYFNG